LIPDSLREQARAIVARYPKPRSALLPMLHLVQSEEGYVSGDGVALCAEVLGLTKAEVGAVATFYTMYKRRPCGDWLVSVCTNLSCQLRGGEEIYERLSDKLGLHHDETDAEGRFTLEHAECLAACDFAPVVTVNYEFYDRQTVASAEALVDALASGQRPMPTRGEALRTFREIERELAGMSAPGMAPATAPAVELPHDPVEHFADAVTSHGGASEHDEGDH
jgi:NADH-quinone oxidoreductase subunit E